ncbi:SusC/RagA family TonB-linked outer membrane protein [Botryobacter ruber]|uniref:SusC/RagA family TonB-linked outer membrane protein n=1 Tax=Botryobacter ruber TaxID=2171629 RepID=UPI000E0B2C20|nr:TonB-dependent receptor [Botryobacter ruber]
MKNTLTNRLQRVRRCRFHASNPGQPATKRLGVVSLLLFFLLLTLPALAQNGRKLSGTVTDNSGTGMPGVTVVVKGTSVGTATDLDGNYALLIPAGSENGTLVFSYVGYTTQEVAIGNQSTLNVSLAPDTKALDEVVVIGYGTQSKKDLTGSVASVKPEDLKSLPVPSVSDAIQGRAAGVQVITSGTPGSDATFRVRGIGTINNSDPLLVIDGIPTMGGLNQLNPNDIESIQVLKDASATAIYGSRGANGVVIVTTKRGKGKKNSLSFDHFTGIQEATNLPQMLNAAQFAALHNEMLANNGRLQNPAFADPAYLGTGTDWLGELFRTAPMRSYTLSYTGSSEKSNYYVSGNVFDQDGVVINTGYKRYTAQFNSDHRVFDRLRFGNNLTLNHDIKTSGNYSIRNAMAALPTQPVFDPDGSYAGPTGQAIWSGDILNPIGQARLIDNTTKGYNLIGSVYGEVDILNELRLKSSLGMQANIWDSRTWAPAYNWEPTPEPDAFLSQQSNKSFTWLWDNTLTYDKFFNDVHHVTAMLGTSAQENSYSNMSGTRKGFISESIPQFSNAIQPPTLGGGANDWSLLSYMARLNYGYNDKYLVTGTIRRDGSSRFGSENKWGWFPSASVAWRVSEEEFLNDVSFLNDLKVRAGYGVTGNQEIGNYAFASFLNTGQYDFNGNIVPTVAPVVMPNPYVQWETVKQANAGFDASFFNSRVNVTLDAYLKNTTGMLVPMAVPVITGYSDIFVPSINAGKMQNKGVELAINTNNLTGKALTWTTDFNISYNVNKVISLNDSIPMTSGSIGFNYNLARIQNNMPINYFYGFRTNGIFQTEEEVDAYATQVSGADPFNRTSPGDIRFADLDEDGVITDADRTFLGNPNSKFIFALNNSFKYKGIDLAVFMQGISGNKIFNANRIWTEGMAVAQNQSIETLNRWNGEGTSNSMPRAVFNDPNKNTRVSDRYIEDGSYLRIKNLTLGYTFPSQLTERIKMASARVYFSAQNLHTFTNYSGIDPEVPGNGIDFNVYPVTRTLSVGVNIGF